LRHEKYGSIVTPTEALLYDLLLEQQKTNELLTELLSRTPAPSLVTQSNLTSMQKAKKQTTEKTDEGTES
jgi:hypothetical protein